MRDIANAFKPFLGSLLALVITVAASFLPLVPSEAAPVLPDDLTSTPEATERVIAEMREIARTIPGANPDAPVSVEYVTEMPEDCHSDTGCAWADGTIRIVRRDSAMGNSRTLIHEVAHALAFFHGDEGDDNHDGHGDTWCRVFGESAAALVPEMMGTCEVG